MTSLWFRNFIPGYTPKRNEGSHSPKDMVKKVFKKERKKASSSFIYKSLKLLRTQMIIVIKVDKKIVAYYTQQ